MPVSRPHIAVVGHGNLGQHLVSGLQSAFHVTVLDRNAKVPEDIDVVIVCVPDDAVKTVCESLPQERFIIHTAGAVPLHNSQRSGVLYPLYSFTKEDEIDWNQIPLLLEATSNEDLALLTRIARTLSLKTFHISSEGRNHLHVSAVMVNNFTNHLYTLAFEHANEFNLPVETLFAIMNQGPSKAIALGPQAAQTGPASRGDQQTVAAHIERISDPEVKQLYTLLSESITKHKA